MNKHNNFLTHLPLLFISLVLFFNKTAFAQAAEESIPAQQTAYSLTKANDSHYTNTVENQEKTETWVEPPAGTDKAHSLYSMSLVDDISQDWQVSDTLYQNNNLSFAIQSSLTGLLYLDAQLGVIYNEKNNTIKSIAADFIGNSIKADVSDFAGFPYVYLYGTAISNQGTIENITGNFTNNNISISKDYNAANIDGYMYGGAISNTGTINKIIFPPRNPIPMAERFIMPAQLTKLLLIL